jgi:hypothetical protein
MTALRIFSGWDYRQAEAAEVFAFSVRERASCDVEMRFLKIDELPIDRRGVTSFTYSRALVPWLCDFDGVACYLDGCDQLCLGDVEELATMPMENGYAVRVIKHKRGAEDRPRSWTSLMLFDCAAPELKRWTPSYVETARDDTLMRLRDLGDDRIGELPEAWNQLILPGNEPPMGTKVAHWSALSDPNGGSWIDRSGSATWAEERERWRASIR